MPHSIVCAFVKPSAVNDNHANNKPAFTNAEYRY